jgi:hypothetical protein
VTQRDPEPVCQDLADEDARRVLAMAVRQGIHVDVVGGVLLLSGPAPAPVREAWRGLLGRHREALVRLLGAAPGAAIEPDQPALPGVRR